ncbi:hypothetical protein D557_3163 [Bordetella holmesii 70147]|nr:hypothetical protein D557_3163 [Bordetella holmesii 70147]
MEGIVGAAPQVCKPLAALAPQPRSRKSATGCTWSADIKVGHAQPR